MRKIYFVEGMHNVYFVFGLVGLIFTSVSLIDHYCSSFDFVILKVDKICEQPLNNRCVDHYLVKKNNGANEIWTPSAYEIRPSELVIGNSLKKDSFAFGYWVNEKKVGWEYSVVHALGLIGSCLILAWWQYLSRRLV